MLDCYFGDFLGNAVLAAKLVAVGSMLSDNLGGNLGQNLVVRVVSRLIFRKVRGVVELAQYRDNTRTPAQDRDFRR